MLSFSEVSPTPESGSCCFTGFFSAEFHNFNEMSCALKFVNRQRFLSLMPKRVIAIDGFSPIATLHISAGLSRQ